jgi:hypothetical protein
LLSVLILFYWRFGKDCEYPKIIKKAGINLVKITFPLSGFLTKLREYDFGLMKIITFPFIQYKKMILTEFEEYHTW